MPLEIEKDVNVEVLLRYLEVTLAILRRRERLNSIHGRLQRKKASAFALLEVLTR